MPHFLPRHRQEEILPAADQGLILGRQIVDAQRIGGIEVLHHESVFKLRPDVEQHDQVVAPSHLFRLGRQGPDIPLAGAGGF